MSSGLDRRSFLIGTSLTALGLMGSSKPISEEPTSDSDLDTASIASPVSNHESPRSCRPVDPLSALSEGNARFAAAWQNKNSALSTRERAEAMSNLWIDNCYLPAAVLNQGQAPWATILCCADSRVAPEWIFDAAPADLFVIRSAGNTAFDEAVASMEYAVSVLGTPLIMVMGHSGCGAVSAARNSDPLTPLLEQLVTPIRASLNDDETLEASIKANAVQAAKRLTERSTLLNAAVSAGNLKIVVSYFDISSGSVSLI